MYGGVHDKGRSRLVHDSLSTNYVSRLATGYRREAKRGVRLGRQSGGRKSGAGRSRFTVHDLYRDRAEHTWDLSKTSINTASQPLDV